MTGEFAFKPIGRVRSPYKRPEDIPPPALAPAGFFEKSRGEIVLRRRFAPALAGIEAGDEIVVIFVFHASGRAKLTVVPPGSGKPRGVFASRSPHRPNPIGLTSVKVMARRGPVLEVSGLDMIDGTPVLDIKPAMHGDGRKPAA